jgi:hypothetical protein
MGSTIKAFLNCECVMLKRKKNVMSYDSKKIRHADKYKFIMTGSLSRKRLNFIRKVQLGSTGQYKLVAAGSTIEDFLNCHRVMLKSQKNVTSYASKKTRHQSAII